MSAVNSFNQIEKKEQTQALSFQLRKVFNITSLEDWLKFNILIAYYATHFRLYSQKYWCIYVSL